MTEVHSITLDQVLPKVFDRERDSHKSSDLWLKDRFVFTRGGRYLVSATSGAGKTSLCAFIYGYRSDYNGSILFDGCDIDTFTAARWDAIRQTALAWLPQEIRLFPSLTAIENVMLKAYMTGYKSEAEIRKMLAAVGMEKIVDRPARSLSIGQQQRVAAVRALCQRFSFLILDEPVSHLDDASNRALSALIEEEAYGQGAGIIITSVGNPPRLTPDKELSL